MAEAHLREIAQHRETVRLHAALQGVALGGGEPLVAEPLAVRQARQEQGYTRELFDGADRAPAEVVRSMADEMNALTGNPLHGQRWVAIGKGDDGAVERSF